ncbi:hypothetical protein IWX46DRAFT_431869 [Phyllosticta citricarpa]|uniref:Uncharacterized protein n=1 Tax=Phyllosticta citricarpa TaxID=55181 RepID=A0ABR1L6F1_9PEZI
MDDHQQQRDDWSNQRWMGGLPYARIGQRPRCANPTVDPHLAPHNHSLTPSLLLHGQHTHTHTHTGSAAPAPNPSNAYAPLRWLFCRSGARHSPLVFLRLSVCNVYSPPLFCPVLSCPPTAFALHRIASHRLASARRRRRRFSTFSHSMCNQNISYRFVYLLTVMPNMLDSKIPSSSKPWRAKVVAHPLVSLRGFLGSPHLLPLLTMCLT